MDGQGDIGRPGKETSVIRQCDGLTGSPGKESFEIKQLDGLTGSLRNETSAKRQCDGLLRSPREEPSEVKQLDGSVTKGLKQENKQETALMLIIQVTVGCSERRREGGGLALIHAGIVCRGHARDKEKERWTRTYPRRDSMPRPRSELWRARLV
jgi:hypothetical protein